MLFALLCDLFIIFLKTLLTIYITKKEKFKALFLLEEFIFKYEHFIKEIIRFMFILVGIFI